MNRYDPERWDRQGDHRGLHHVMYDDNDRKWYNFNKMKRQFRVVGRGGFTPCDTPASLPARLNVEQTVLFERRADGEFMSIDWSHEIGMGGGGGTSSPDLSLRSCPSLSAGADAAFAKAAAEEQANFLAALGCGDDAEAMETKEEVAEAARLLTQRANEARSEASDDILTYRLPTRDLMMPHLKELNLSGHSIMGDFVDFFKVLPATIEGRLSL